MNLPDPSLLARCADAHDQDRAAGLEWWGQHNDQQKIVMWLAIQQAADSEIKQVALLGRFAQIGFTEIALAAADADRRAAAVAIVEEDLVNDPGLPPLNCLTEPELSRLMTAVARSVKACLPGGTLFTVLAFDDPGVAQYVSNAQRADIIKAMRETADRLERKEDIPRG